jgi:16S rRNA (uracil1498-N3)-methyltransferase
MPHDRFYHPEPFIKNHSFALGDEEAHHLRVMRIRTGETIEIVNGLGQLAQAEVSSIDKKSTLVSVTSIHEEPVPSRQIILAQAIPKLTRLDGIVEKGTELGMTQLWLFPGQRSEKNILSTNQQQRVSFLAVSALKQCGRLYLPKIVFMPPLNKWDECPPTAFFGDIAPQAPLFHNAWMKQKPQDTVFFTGPEAGFTAEEMTQLKKLGAQGVSLHKNILRTDTASLAALSLISHLEQVSAEEHR